MARKSRGGEGQKSPPVYEVSPQDPGLKVPDRVAKVIPVALARYECISSISLNISCHGRICNFIVHGLHSSHKIAFLLLFVIRAVYANIDDEELGEVMFSLSEFVHEFDDFDTEDDPDWDENSRDMFSVRLSCFLKALKPSKHARFSAREKKITAKMHVKYIF